MTATTTSELDLLRARMSGSVGAQMPGHVQRLGWSPGQLAAFQRDRLRALLARAIERSPFHAARLRGLDPARFELADLPRLPVMTKTQLMDNFDAAVTDRRLSLDLVERHLASSHVEPSLLLGEHVCVLSGGSSGLRGLFVQTIGEYADFVCGGMRRQMAAAIASGGPPPERTVSRAVSTTRCEPAGSTRLEASTGKAKSAEDAGAFALAIAVHLLSAAFRSLHNHSASPK